MALPVSDLDVVQLAAAFRHRDLSPVEVAEAVLARVEDTQATLNAFCAVDHDGARAAAARSEKRWKEGAPLGPLDGVPVSIKDNIYADRMPTRFGSRAIAEADARGPDSPAVARLREAGTVVFGKTTLPDYAHKVVTDSPLTGVTRNPWDLTRSPGGSSGGAAAAIAAGIGALAVGTDGGGSIRVPAAWTGIFGLKPSFGRVPHHPRGAFPTVSHVGPMTRTVTDAALMMTAMTRPDARDWYALPADGMDYVAALPRDGLKGLRIAISADLGMEGAVDRGIADRIALAFRTAEHLGAAVEAAHPAEIPALAEVHRVHWCAFSARLARRLGDGADRLDPSMQGLVAAGNALSPEAFVDSVVTRGELGSRVFQFFERFDLLLAPVTGIAPPVMAALDPLSPPIPRLTSWANQTGLPAASLPCGLDADSLPVGLQIVAGPRADAFLLSVCRVLEGEFGTFRPPAA